MIEDKQSEVKKQKINNMIFNVPVKRSALAKVQIFNQIYSK